MGLIEIRPVNASARLGFWKRDYMPPGGAAARKQGLTEEFLRFLHSFPGLEDESITYDGHGRPFLRNPDKGHISISHSGEMLVLMHDRLHPTGVDYELVRDKIYVIAHKFLSPREKKEIGDHPDRTHLHVYWGAKESLYKMYGQRGLLFAKNIYIHPVENPEKGITRGVIRKDSFFAEKRIAFKKEGGYMLVYLIND